MAQITQLKKLPEGRTQSAGHSIHRYAMGIDIGGHKIEGSIVGSEGSVIRTLRWPTPRDYTSTKDSILRMIKDLTGKEPLLGIGFSIPGSIDPQTGVLRNAPNSDWINNTKFFPDLAADIALPLRCENDANCLAMSEHRFGAASDCENVVGIIMGSGVGVGHVHQNQVFSGTHGLAPELGHIPLKIDGRPCLCGNTGCVEAYLSGPSILRRYWEAGGHIEIKDTKLIFDRIGKDAVAKKIIDETMVLFQRFVAAVISIYDPQCLVIGGGLSLQNIYYEQRNATAQYIFGSRTPPDIRPAQLGDASGKLGAAALFF